MKEHDSQLQKGQLHLFYSIKIKAGYCETSLRCFPKTEVWSYMEESTEQGECYSVRLHLRLWKNKLIYALFSRSVMSDSLQPHGL